jgi:hypothetical protein
VQEFVLHFIVIMRTVIEFLSVVLLSYRELSAQNTGIAEGGQGKTLVRPVHTTFELQEEQGQVMGVRAVGAASGAESASARLALPCIVCAVERVEVGVEGRRVDLAGYIEVCPVFDPSSAAGTGGMCVEVRGVSQAGERVVRVVDLCRPAGDTAAARRALIKQLTGWV